MYPLSLWDKPKENHLQNRVLLFGPQEVPKLWDSLFLFQLLAPRIPLLCGLLEVLVHIIGSRRGTPRELHPRLMGYFGPCLCKAGNTVAPTAHRAQCQPVPGLEVEQLAGLLTCGRQDKEQMGQRQANPVWGKLRC